MATNADIYRFCCDLLFDCRSGFIRRRKETVEMISEAVVRHRMSLDFLTEGLPSTYRGSELRTGRPAWSETICFVPVALLRKEPGVFTRFDVVDEGGRSLPLPGRDRNAQVAGGVLVEAARRVLGGAISVSLRTELALIAKVDKDLALAMVKGAYRNPEAPLAHDPDAPARRQLWADSRFRWLLEALARSSVLVIGVPLDERPRRIVKLSYDEAVEDVTRIRARPLRGKREAIASRFGWRGYLLEVYSPYIGGSSYHFEFHAPEGTQLLAAGLDDGTAADADARHAHVYVQDARERRSSVAWAQLRVRGPGFVGTAALTAFTIFVALVGAWWQASRLKDTTTSAPALLLLFPGLVGGYISRPTHPLVSRLLVFARWTLMLCTLTAYLGAARLAIVSQQHAASAHALREYFSALATIAGLSTIALIATWLGPRRHRARTGSLGEDQNAAGSSSPR